MIVKLLITLAFILSILVPFGAFAAGEKSRGRYKKALAINSFLFFGTMLVCSALFFTGNAFAAEASAAGASVAGWGYLAAALATGMSCIGGGIAVSAAASAALGAISEDGSILGKSLIFVGLAEGVGDLLVELVDIVAGDRVHQERAHHHHQRNDEQHQDEYQF